MEIVLLWLLFEGVFYLVRETRDDRQRPWSLVYLTAKVNIALILIIHTSLPAQETMVFNQDTITLNVTHYDQDYHIETVLRNGEETECLFYKRIPIGFFAIPEKKFIFDDKFTYKINHLCYHKTRCSHVREHVSLPKNRLRGY